MLPVRAPACAALVLWVAGCARGPAAPTTPLPVASADTTASDSMPQAGRLPPIPVARGPLALRVVYPAPDAVVTARDSTARLVGVSRSVTDFAFACYLSDLAVALDHQHGGVGRRLIEVTLDHLEPGAKIVLLAAPAAVDYYAKVGFTQHPSAWIRDR